MENYILDAPDFAPDDIILKLKNAQFARCYKTMQNEIVVEDEKNYGAVSVKVVNKAGKAEVVRKFPQIGSVPQITVTVLFIVISYVLLREINFILAIIAGQLLSMVYFLPKTTAFRNRVEAALKV
jgi:hypothetical protein